MAKAIYLDNLATTPVDPRVVEAMLPYFTEHFGNASSKGHSFGWAAAEAVEEARAQVAALIGASPNEIIFTSGATESNHLAIKGVVRRAKQQGGHIITCVTEHHSVLDCCRRLEREGVRVTYLPVDKAGGVDLKALEAALSDDTLLVAIMAANNEIGTLHPVAEIGCLCRDRGVLWHCDAAQAVGKVVLDVRGLGMGLLALSGHKVYGPKGIGALYIARQRPPIRLLPQLEGGGQERGIRAGTLNVPGIVGLGKACQLAKNEMAAEDTRLTGLRQRLYRGLSQRLEGVCLNGDAKRRLPGNLHLSFASIDGAALVVALADRLALSAGAACSSGTGEISHVLSAIGLADKLAQASLRFGLGRFTTAAQIDAAIDLVAAAVDQYRDEAKRYSDKVA